MRRLTKSRTDKQIEGICAGFAEYFGWDPTWVRIAYAILTVGSVGTGIVLYIVLAFVIPDADEVDESSFDEDHDFEDYDDNDTF